MAMHRFVVVHNALHNGLKLDRMSCSVPSKQPSWCEPRSVTCRQQLAVAIHSLSSCCHLENLSNTTPYSLQNLYTACMLPARLACLL